MKRLIKKLIPVFLLNYYHLALVFLGALLYGFPGKNRKVKIIGVTGTSGKSTTVDLISKILEEAGNKVASLSTVRFKINREKWENKLKMTMPGRMKIQKFLRQALKRKCDFIVIEVSSEGIRQNRHRLIDFDCAVFTNLSPEHIESHGSFEKYRNEKLKFFKGVKNFHIVNSDDKNAQYFLNTEAKKRIVFGFKNNYSAGNFKRIIAENIIIKPDGSNFIIDGISFSLNLLGKFNIYNALAAISVASAYGINLEICAKSLKSAKGIAGRMEIVFKNPFKIIVDYAHTPDQLENVYKTIPNPLICVLGSCGGGRDKWKRPVLGKIADKYCRKIITTNEDPYDEDPGQILSEIKSGISNSKIQNNDFLEILDRKNAIKEAIKLARPGDTVIITGKGSEPWMCVKNNKKIPWSDTEIVQKTMKELLGIK